ncbi:LysR family transcriptional regulator [Aureimonas altamirensis]|uniref:LysR family transcriptional regulator n=1 Tax=Aureimonas altamirensis TaxID=370622 RepID=UPI0020368568|nr:LysR family transcriptional regulator [Aureimonas altamirensis]MCM2502370.1 LysR family transcriptional regulator [Aureimonas altamirensis]
MDIRLLQSFVTLAEELNFVRAAARLGLSQPALSQQIARLEALLGVEVVDRTRRQVALTFAGQTLVPEAEELIRRWNVTSALARRAAGGLHGAIRMGFVDAAAFRTLPDLMSAYTARYPDVLMNLHSMVSHRQVDELRAGRIDIALMRPWQGQEDFETLLLSEERYVVALGAGHRLAGKAAIAIEDLRDEPFIAATRNKSRYIDGRFRDAFAARGIVPHIVQEVDDLHAILALVASGFGLALFPESVAVIRFEGAVYRPILRSQSPTAQLLMAWNRKSRFPALDNLVAIARQRGAMKAG